MTDHAAQNALRESRESAARSRRVIAEAAEVSARVRDAREVNHFAEKFRAILQGGSRGHA